MASIPNLNTLRSGRRGPRLRRGAASGLESGGDNSSFDERSAESGKDAIIRQTDDDASNSRMSAVALGYLDDPFASAFLPPGQEIPKRYPIINRGTYVRTNVLDGLVARFLRTNTEQRKQIISLGAGSDTRFYRLASHSNDNSYSNVDYHELDFEENVNRKRSVVRNNTAVSDILRKAENDGWMYRLNALDLRDLTKKSPPTISDLQPDLPTLLLSECCLCYLPPDTVSSVIQYFAMHINAPLALILYEAIRPFDAFGKTMVSNLGSRGIHLQTLKQYSSLEAQKERLKLAGFDGGQRARDVHQLWNSQQWISQGEKDRIEKLEWLDEIEEWALLASHYCVAWGWRGELFSEAWYGLEG